MLDLLHSCLTPSLPSYVRFLVYHSIPFSGLLRKGTEEINLLIAGSTHNGTYWRRLTSPCFLLTKSDYVLAAMCPALGIHCDLLRHLKIPHHPLPRGWHVTEFGQIRESLLGGPLVKTLPRHLREYSGLLGLISHHCHLSAPQRPFCCRQLLPFQQVFTENLLCSRSCPRYENTEVLATTSVSLCL